MNEYYEKITEKTLKNRSNENKSENLTSFQVNSECFDVQLSESDLDEINQEEDNLNDEI
ncbi:19493_t:CDS:2 [Rhizophagus irregularis]|nr:19493_t:CDS:2 [Rhizophagus irregularis]